MYPRSPGSPPKGEHAETRTPSRRRGSRREVMRFAWNESSRAKDYQQETLLPTGLGTPGNAHRREMPLEPIPREARHLVERTLLFEEMRGSRHDHEIFLALKLLQRLLIQLEHQGILA